jgi:RimJ/RimL family protein N-acetyltransferase
MNNLFRSSRLLYRAYEAPADDEFFLSCQLDPEVFFNAINFLPRPWSAASATEARKAMSEDALIYVVICKIPDSQLTGESGSTNDKESGKPTPTPIGILSLNKLSDPNLAHHRSAKLGIFLDTGYHGKGYGPEAVEWALDWAFTMAGLHRVGLEVYEWNQKAQKVYEKLGFVTEGRERESSWYHGRWWDNILMSMLDYEWEKLRKKDDLHDDK